MHVCTGRISGHLTVGVWGLSMHTSLCGPGSLCVNPNMWLLLHVWLWVWLHLSELFVCEGWIGGVSEDG